MRDTTGFLILCEAAFEFVLLAMQGSHFGTENALYKSAP